ncbi:PREDICTED: uncharacterized protein LOC105973289 [Erythranthe guttata]|uniref:uncharacterized protein LOC105973289 n=1 Tax=Erythranthe guttata TaxID=4155 RepID=UPI00064D7905|nr:PREDICTED: uncharacterized protein LOC105973289 [Erythranthe guttata]|eukprot:XP_012853766.1 PREDICTED: uncharacterized protein LOC105973289 [Erythranthe guttata]
MRMRMCDFISFVTFLQKIQNPLKPYPRQREIKNNYASSCEEAEHQERERMTMSTRRRREAERAGEARSSVPHPDVGSSRAMEEEEEDDAVDPVHETEVVARGGRGGRGQGRGGRGGRAHTRVNPDVLDGPFPGGPRDPSLIPSFNSHERPVGRVESRINSLNQFNYEKITAALEDIDVSVDKHFLRMTGLYPLARCYLPGLDAPLLFAFVERWQPETNNFHMPWEEMTITLHDVQMILCANVEGRVVAPRYDEVIERTNCVYLLAEVLNLEFEEINESWKHGGPTWRMIHGHLLMPDTPMRRRVQIYLVFLLGSILFPDMTCDRVKPWYMHVLEDSVLDQKVGYMQPSTVEGLRGLHHPSSGLDIRVFPEIPVAGGERALPRVSASMQEVERAAKNGRARAY